MSWNGVATCHFNPTPLPDDITGPDQEESEEATHERLLLPESGQRRPPSDRLLSNGRSQTQKDSLPTAATAAGEAGAEAGAGTVGAAAGGNVGLAGVGAGAGAIVGAQESRFALRAMIEEAVRELPGRLVVAFAQALDPDFEGAHTAVAGSGQGKKGAVALKGGPGVGVQEFGPQTDAAGAWGKGSGRRTTAPEGKRKRGRGERQLRDENFEEGEEEVGMGEQEEIEEGPEDGGEGEALKKRRVRPAKQAVQAAVSDEPLRSAAERKRGRVGSPAAASPKAQNVIAAKGTGSASAVAVAQAAAGVVASAVADAREAHARWRLGVQWAAQ
eukprot:scaffold93926_cov17-Tisochrysis_lutea.AAC.1